jgi:hypothetical protein
MRETRGRPVTGPTIHGTYDYWLGGGQHLREDRELAQAIEARFPSVPLHVRAAQDFHLRAARWAAERGISRFVHAGNVTALPSGRNVHDAAREVNPGAEVVYAYRHQAAYSFSAGLLGWDEGATAFLSRTGGFLAADPVMAWVEEGEPVCLVAGLVLHFLDAGTAAARVARAAAGLPPGSVIVVSMTLPGTRPAAGEMLAMFTPAVTFRHTAADLTGWLEDAGLKIVPPGVADVRVVPDPGRPCGEALQAGPHGMIGGVVAVKP